MVARQQHTGFTVTVAHMTDQLLRQPVAINMIICMTAARSRNWQDIMASAITRSGGAAQLHLRVTDAKWMSVRACNVLYAASVKRESNARMSTLSTWSHSSPHALLQLRARLTSVSSFGVDNTSTYTRTLIVRGCLDATYGSRLLQQLACKGVQQSKDQLVL